MILAPYVFINYTTGLWRGNKLDPIRSGHWMLQDYLKILLLPGVDGEGIVEDRVLPTTFSQTQLKMSCHMQPVQ